MWSLPMPRMAISFGCCPGEDGNGDGKEEEDAQDVRMGAVRATRVVITIEAPWRRERMVSASAGVEGYSVYVFPDEAERKEGVNIGGGVKMLSRRTIWTGFEVAIELVI